MRMMDAPGKLIVVVSSMLSWYGCGDSYTFFASPSFCSDRDFTTTKSRSASAAGAASASASSSRAASPATSATMRRAISSTPGGTSGKAPADSRSPGGISSKPSKAPSGAAGCGRWPSASMLVRWKSRSESASTLESARCAAPATGTALMYIFQPQSFTLPSVCQKRTASLAGMSSGGLPATPGQLRFELSLPPV